MSAAFGSTLHTAPGHSESSGHQMLQRAAMVRQVAQGIFAYLPLGLRTLRKIEDILRTEMERIGGQEVRLPVVNPAELWKQSGRYSQIGPELARFADRRGRDLVLAMTHEEVITSLARSEVGSYRDLPRLAFQVQTKFRDDARPRAGLIRVREFTMKDAYSFDRDNDGLRAQYRAQYQAYFSIFARCGVPVRAVLADVGMMGGTLAHEFMYLTPIGEDTLLFCEACGFAANREVASFRKPEASNGPALPTEEVATPGASTIDALAAALGITAAETAKVVFLTSEDKFVVAVVRGDMEVSETRLANVVGAAELRPMTADEIRSIGAVPGYGSPIGITGATIVVDHLVFDSKNFVAGANREGFHLRNVNAWRDHPVDIIANITAARAGDPCVECGHELSTTRGVEMGNIFKLGTKYSAELGALYVDAGGERRPLIMGCYGIGVDRLLGCAAQEHHDDKGLRLPASIAPYHVHLTLLADVDSEAGRVAQRVYEQLWSYGVEVLFDDRAVRAGVKFADADVMGLPLRVTIGKRGTAEVRDRATGEATSVPFDDVVTEVRERIADMLAKLAEPVTVSLPREVR
ncbi:proline--tRNA ligase [Actinoplanes sp. TFC3]|uniref:proline--tRNA ligase n=1 Tax=Actinoplanes sp. TFC3 TaxID=1710355 RepID=UPI000830B4AE|nr:proline--tRNA ligase [Actinoplanes sp. TFC3]